MVVEETLERGEKDMEIGRRGKTERVKLDVYKGVRSVSDVWEETGT